MRQVSGAGPGHRNWSRLGEGGCARLFGFGPPSAATSMTPCDALLTEVLCGYRHQGILTGASKATHLEEKAIQLSGTYVSKSLRFDRNGFPARNPTPAILLGRKRDRRDIIGGSTFTERPCRYGLQGFRRLLRYFSVEAFVSSTRMGTSSLLTRTRQVRRHAGHFQPSSEAGT